MNRSQYQKEWKRNARKSKSFRMKENKISKLWYKNNKEKILKKLRKKRNNLQYKEKQSQYYKNWYKLYGRKRTKNYQNSIKKWKKNHQQEVYIYGLIRVAIKKGKIKKSKQCSFCNRKVKIYGHHSDYSKPFDVIWLCGSCHKKIHLTNIKQNSTME